MAWMLTSILKSSAISMTSLLCSSKVRNDLANNQPAPQPTAAVRFLIHTAWSLFAGALTAALVTLANYIYTDGQSVDIRTVALAAGFAFVGFLAAHIRTDVQPNQTELLQGIS